MFYLLLGISVLVCVYGVFVDDYEVYVVVDDWKKCGKLNYIDEILSGDVIEEILLFGEISEDGDEELDLFYDEVVLFVIEIGKVLVLSV